MRRKVAAACATALTLAFSGGALAKGQHHEGQSARQQPAAAETTTGIEFSELSPEGIKMVQRELQQRGHYEGEIDGIAGPQTKAALEEFQEEEDLGAGESAKLTAKFSQLNEEGVKNVQQQLQEHGLYSGDIDGSRNAETMAALRQFEDQQEWRVSARSQRGSLDDATLSALGLDADELAEAEAQAAAEPEAGEVEPVSGTEEPSREAAQPQKVEVPENAIELSSLNDEQVRNLQTRLKDEGLYKGEIDGKVGPLTRSALRQFYNRQAQLAAQGVMTEESASALGIDVGAAQPVRGTEEQQQPEQQQRQQQPEQQQPEQQQRQQQNAPEQSPYQQQQMPQRTPEQ